MKHTGIGLITNYQGNFNCFTIFKMLNNFLSIAAGTTGKNGYPHFRRLFLTRKTAKYLGYIFFKKRKLAKRNTYN